MNVEQNKKLKITDNEKKELSVMKHYCVHNIRCLFSFQTDLEPN